MVLLCIGVFILACGQAQPYTAEVKSTQSPTATLIQTTEPTPTDEATATPAAAHQAAAPQTQVTRTANLRQGPGTSYPVIRTVTSKTTIDLISVREENGQRWYRVRAGSDEGWLSGTVLSVDKDVAAALPVDIQAMAPPSTATPKPVAVIKPTTKPVAIVKPTAEPVEPAIVAPSTGVRVGAICRDGTRSYATGRGACSHHGGVDHWLVN